MEKKTINEWCNEYKTAIISYDGFRETDDNDLLTRKEFLRGMMTSTIQLNPEIVDALNNINNM